MLIQGAYMVLDEGKGGDSGAVGSRLMPWGLLWKVGPVEEQPWWDRGDGVHLIICTAHFQMGKPRVSVYTNRDVLHISFIVIYLFVCVFHLTKIYFLIPVQRRSIAL